MSESKSSDPAPESDTPPSPASFARGPEEGPAIWFLGTLMTIKATSEMTGQAFGLIEQILPAGFAPPPHIHHREDEAFYVLEGQLTFTCGERVINAPANTFVFLPRNIIHGFRVEGDQQARLLQFTMPGGLEEMFVQAGEPALARTLPPPSPPQVDKLLALTERYGFEIAGLPPDRI